MNDIPIATRELINNGTLNTIYGTFFINNRKTYKDTIDLILKQLPSNVCIDILNTIDETVDLDEQLDDSMQYLLDKLKFKISNKST